MKKEIFPERNPERNYEVDIMKRKWQKLAAALLALSVLLFAGCSQAPRENASQGEGTSQGENSQGETSKEESQPEESSPSSPYVGKWELTSVTENGQELSKEEIEEGLGGSSLKMILYADGSMEVSLDSQTVSGTWEEDGESKLKLINGDGEEETFTVGEDGTLLAELADNVEGVFTRTGDAPEKEDSDSSKEENEEVSLSQLEGKWVLVSVRDGDDVTTDWDEMIDALNMTDDVAEMWVEISDGQYKAVAVNDEGQEYTGSQGDVEINGSEISLNSDDYEQKAYLEDGKMYMDATTCEACFEKK